MPPKAKYTKEQITAVALDIVSERGMQALTAKSLGKALGTSTSPIFTVFSSMQEVQEAVKEAAMARFEAYAHKASGDEPAFKQVGLQMITFAKEEPKLYQLLFMSANTDADSFDDIYGHLGGVTDECIAAICKDYKLPENDAKELFEHVWIHTFGIGALCAGGVCSFSNEKISQMLTQDFTAMMTMVKSRKEA